MEKTNTVPSGELTRIREQIKNNSKKILGFITLGIAITIFVVFYTKEQETLTSLKNYQWQYAFYTLCMVCGAWVLHGVKITIMARALGSKLSLRGAISAFLLSNGLRNIYPVAGSSETLRIYFLKRNGLPVEQGSVVVMMTEGGFDIIVSIFFVVLCLIFSSPLELGQNAKDLSQSVQTVFPWILSGGLVIFLCFALILILKPQWMIKICSQIITRKPLIWILKKDRAARINEKVKRFFLNFQENGKKLFKKEKIKYIIPVFIVSACQFALSYSFIVVFAKGFGISLNFWDFIFWTTVIATVIMFVPTPAGAGPQEILFSAIFAAIVPKELLGILLVAWLFFTRYFTIIIAGLMWFRLKEEDVSYENRTDE